MGMWGARPKGRQNEPDQSSALPAGRLDQLMTFVERAAVPAAPAPAPAPAPVPVLGRVVPDAPVVAFPDPILVTPAPVAGKRRRLLPQSA